MYLSGLWRAVFISLTRIIQALLFERLLSWHSFPQENFMSLSLAIVAHPFVPLYLSFSSSMVSPSPFSIFVPYFSLVLYLSFTATLSFLCSLFVSNTLLTLTITRSSNDVQPSLWGSARSTAKPWWFSINNHRRQNDSSLTNRFSHCSSHLASLISDPNLLAPSHQY